MVSADDAGDDSITGPGTEGYHVRAVERTLVLLEAVASDGGRGKTLSEVARTASMAEPTTLRYLSTLVRRGYVEHEGSGERVRYRLGLGAFMLAERSIAKSDVRGVVLPRMLELRERFGETVNFAAFRQRRLVIIEVVEGRRSIRQGARVGEQDRLGSTALGKAMLAEHPDEEALALLRAEGAERLTPNTIVDEAAMLRELRSIRSRGYAVDDEESETGLRCVGVALSGRGSERYALSISGPSHLFTKEVVRAAGPVLCAAAAEVQAQLRPGGSALDRARRAPR
jgi:DNA-binding IclR family transcriptional regulator